MITLTNIQPIPIKYYFLTKYPSQALNTYMSNEYPSSAFICFSVTHLHPDASHLKINYHSKQVPFVLCTLFKTKIFHAFQHIFQAFMKKSLFFFLTILYLQINIKFFLFHSWEDFWDLMSNDCRDECCVVETDHLLDMLESYLQKHK